MQRGCSLNRHTPRAVLPYGACHNSRSEGFYEASKELFMKDAGILPVGKVWLVVGEQLVNLKGDIVCNGNTVLHMQNCTYSAMHIAKKPKISSTSPMDTYRSRVLIRVGLKLCKYIVCLVASQVHPDPCEHQMSDHMRSNTVRKHTAHWMISEAQYLPKTTR